MIFSAALQPFLQRRPQALDLIEIEPQTLWMADDPFHGPFFEFTPGIDLIEALPGRKLVHSVGMPLGGTRTPDAAQCALLRATAERLESPWVSEHLAVGGTPHRASGFFLPPLQTEESVAIAAANIRAFSRAVGRPVAIETGVAYIARKPFEMMDGAFVARIVEETGCGILLDLHNIYCNEKNGRCSMDDFLADLPLENVWEVHLAGGMEMDGYWLDSHSGPMPDDLRTRSLEIVRHLPNLGALNFEIYDSFIRDLDQPTYDRITDELHEIWAEAGTACDEVPVRTPPRPVSATGKPSPRAWEHALTQSVWKDTTSGYPWPEDAEPLKLYAKLARSFRGSMLARALPRTIRYLLLRDGPRASTMMQDYFSDVSPALYAPLEARAFVDWLESDRRDDAMLAALCDYDLALVSILRENAPQVVTFPGNPAPVFEALAEARLPEMPQPPQWELEILPDAEVQTAFHAAPS